MQLPVPKARTATAAFNKNVVLKKLKAHFKRRHRKTGLKYNYLRLLRDNAPAHEARIGAEFLQSENVKVLPHPSYSHDLAPFDYFLFTKLKFILCGKKL